MELDIISYQDLQNQSSSHVNQLENALLQKGVVGISEIPHFETKSRSYIDMARQFSALDNVIKQQYLPERDAGKTEGYELGAEWFKDKNGEWRIDDKKASYYAYVPDRERNKWPTEVDLKTPYLALGELIFQVGKQILDAMGINAKTGLPPHDLVGYGRMLHYHKESIITDANPYWCGSHCDHGVLTGLLPAYYFRNGIEIPEPNEAGLYIKPTNGQTFEKIHADDKSILLFQAGEFGQILSNDRIHATQHQVRKAFGEIERYTFALFHTPEDHVLVNSHSRLTEDARYKNNQSIDGSLLYGKWAEASYARYHAKLDPDHL